MIDFTDRDMFYEENPEFYANGPDYTPKEDEGKMVDEGCGCCGYCLKCAKGYAQAEMAFIDLMFDYERRWGIKCPQN